MTTETRELKRDEFFLAEKLWEQYRDQKADPLHERIFGVFVDGDLAATARYTKHPDGLRWTVSLSLKRTAGRAMPGMLWRS